MTKVRNKLLLCLFIPLVLVLPVIAGDSKVVGIITKLEGGWTFILPDGSRKPVKPLDGVPEGSRLTSTEKKAVAEIELVDRRRIVNRGRTANKPIYLVDEKSDFWKEAIHLLSREPQYFASTSSRGADSPIDTVISCQDGKLDLSPVLQEITPDELEIDLSQMGSKTEKEKVGSYHVTWSKETAIVPAESLKEGIYEVTIHRRKGDLVAWVLILNPDKYESIEHDWQEVLSRAKKFSDDGNPNSCSRASFKKAFLFSLARKAGVL